MLKKSIFVSFLAIFLLVWSLPIMAEQSATDQAENIFSSTATKTPGAILWHCDVQHLTPPTDSEYQCLGVETLRDTIYITGGGNGVDPNNVYVWLRTGGTCTYLYKVNQPAASTGWGWRDIACDGNLLYASYGTVLNAFYVTPGGVVEVPASNITFATLNPIRAVAYDPDHDWFWAANFNTNIYAFNRSGVQQASYANTYSIYGLAYDNVTPGGPYLWAHVQDSCNIYQFKIATGTYTGVVYSGWGDDDPGVTGIAGGLCVLERGPSIKGNNVTLLGITQMVSPNIDEMYAMEIYVAPQDTLSVLPGVDLWSTPCGGATVDSHFTVMPLPPGFFGPGSDPFAGDVAFKGEPLTTTPPGILGPSDVIVERPTRAVLPACGDSDTVPIEIIALSLTSINPITVTYYGGSNPELWDVKACLSSTQPQSVGSMIIRQECPAGGTFNATLPVTPKFIFIRQSDLAQRVLDLGGMLTINFETGCKGHWTYSDPGFGIFTSPGGLTVDHDCNPSTPEVPVGASSNFIPGVQAVPCTCSQPAQEYKKRMTHEEAQLAAHGVLPPEHDTLDRDHDCIPDIADNCPDTYNPYQTDTDCDGIGDACEQESLYWKPPYPDYAPSGMPDFDQKQDNWKKGAWQYTFCGPVAVANCFWWFDSKYNVPAGVPGDANDRFPLVRDYLDALAPRVGLDDHDPWNVNHVGTAWFPGGTPPATLKPFVPGAQTPGGGLTPWGELVERLAYFFNTDGWRTGIPNTGTNVIDMQQGIQMWLESEHFQNGSTLADTLCERTWKSPTFAKVESLVEKSQDVILLLGFWYENPPGSGQWFRCGGHYVTVAGVNSDSLLIAISDPYYDWAEEPYNPGPGRIGSGSLIPHTIPHLSDPTIHNDAGNVSQDIYAVIPQSPSPGGVWSLPNYPVSLHPSQCEFFDSANVPAEFLPVSAPWSGLSPIFTEVEYAVEISPWGWDYRGDVNGDGIVDASDLVYLLNYLFAHGPAPVPLSEADVTCDGIVDVSDLIYLLNYLFVHGPEPKCRVCDP